jgi:hypothetical protein
MYRQIIQATHGHVEWVTACALENNKAVKIIKGVLLT